ncbi:hypothetical protein C8R43DRAFT_1140400 [Mycena crocata]|nr:hypothetical protein C8R43DRAFT_1140400 [Mycena crocata]
MRSALKTLGYKNPHHFDAVMEDPAQVDAWMTAINAKFFGQGTPYGLKEWDSLLGNCEVSATNCSSVNNMMIICACAFLGDDVPDVEFPHTNDTETFKKRADAATYFILRKAAKQVLLPALGVAVLIGGIYAALSGHI